MAIQSNFPAIKPSLLLDFANTKQLDPRITFTRTSTATFYNGVTTAMAEQNLAPRSQELSDTSVWSTQAITVTANTSVAPDGTTTADTITASATAATHFLFFGSYPTVAIGIQLGCSVYAKAGTNNFFQLTVLNQANTYANFDLSTGTIGTTGSNVSSVTMTSVGSGWYRCSFVITSTTDAANSALTFLPVASNSVGRIPTWTPTGTETVILWGAQVEQRSAVTAYTATTTQAITNYIPVLQTAASGVARFDNNPTTGESLGLLIEESRTNAVLYSSQFDDGYWVKIRTTVTGNTIVSPDGSLTGDKLIATSVSGSHVVYKDFAANTYTFSCFAKAGEYNFLMLFTGANGRWFDLSNGTLGGSYTNTTTATITPVGNGWYRCSVTFTNSATDNLYIAVSNANNVLTFAGNDFSGIYIWGAQVEAGAFATSYIPTVASQVTRAADAASMTGTNFSSWYNAGEGTLYAEAVTQTVGSKGIVGLDAGSSANSLSIFTSGSTVAISEMLRNNSIEFTFSIGRGTKYAVGFKTNDTNFANNTTIGTTDTVCLMTQFTQLQIGGIYNQSNFLANGTIKKLAYYPTRVTNTQLQALTS